MASAVEPYLKTRRPSSTAALVVEVADSSLGLDRRLKSALYARAGSHE